MNKGFTLIELLVVVLIIGILSSIALPQYTRAVERSRMAKAVQVLGDLGTAQSIFLMQHDRFASSLNELNTLGDVVIQDPTAQKQWRLLVNSDGSQTMARDGGIYDGAYLSLAVGTDGSITKQCVANGHPEFCTMAQAAGYVALPPPPPDSASAAEA